MFIKMRGKADDGNRREMTYGDYRRVRKRKEDASGEIGQESDVGLETRVSRLYQQGVKATCEQSSQDVRNPILVR